jgi:hypothetical protein
VPLPSASIAATGATASPPGWDRFLAGLQAPVAADAEEACAIECWPSERTQTATALPRGSSATSGATASPPAGEIVLAGSQGPPAGLCAARTTQLRPFDRVHTATASPRASTAS